MKKKVLVVDDELDVRTFISTLLETNGYKPIIAEDGESGYLIAKEKQPDLVVLDVMMPKESGIKMYRQLRTDPELMAIPVIMVSGIAKKTFMHSQKVLNDYTGTQVPEPEAYIEKPPEADELLAYVLKLTA